MEGLNELDLTNHHHENIVNGIQNIKKIYKMSSSEAKHCVETAYNESISKIPTVLAHFQESADYIKSLLLNLEKNSLTTQYTFTLLKCNHVNGIG